ncbi:NAD(P)H-dependent flavin oxidoreductase [Paenibacillus silvisoli]|uniref:NAD(P)H-dependent flavin oxidoreductase n=1 Tax=Paenibacillus silvisoli TaxID=3110539 RepID=UPI002803DCE4|nr:DUF561 domain-containing protein [Paenibacillus silvisoli]
MFQSAWTEKLGIRYPILLAPMAGGPSTPELVAAVSNAGGLGSVGAGYLKPDQIRSAIHEIRKLTDRPFGVNLFVPELPDTTDEAAAEMIKHLNTYRTELGLTPIKELPVVAETFAEQVQVLLDEQVAVFSFTFGIPSKDILDAMKKKGITVIGTATTVEEAKRLEASGIDAIVAQGSEAGGHRGTFIGQAEDALIGTMALVPQIVDHVSIPVIASGGIMDGRGMAASFALGAAAVQMGTAFLAAPESGAHAVYKEKLLTSPEDSTEVTRSYSGKPARGIRTAFMDDMRGYTGTIPAYPIQNALTREIRQAAAKANNPELMSLWAGQGLRLATSREAAAIMEQTIGQAEELVKRMSAL